LKNAGGFIAGNNIRQFPYYALWQPLVDKYLLLIAMSRAGTKRSPLG